jgi:glutamate-1-semialdehyde 2,1-aminomutase
VASERPWPNAIIALKFARELSRLDLELAAEKLKGFLPREIFDLHAHVYHPAHFAAGAWEFLQSETSLGCARHRAALSRYLPSQTIHGLYFGLPHATAQHPAINTWVLEDLRSHGTQESRALLLASPQDSQEHVAAELRSGRFCGLKVYHCYSARPDTFNALVSEYTPEWMWELLQEVRGVLMLHLVRDDAIADADNQSELRRLCRTYPNVPVVLAHIGRSFNYRNARNGLRAIADLPNVVVDTSAICESEAFRAAIDILGPQRVLFGSDFPISELRGRCITTGSSFFWLHPESLQPELQAAAATDMTLIGIESLLCLREVCEDAGLVSDDVLDIFLRNALRILPPSPSKPT